MDTPIADTAADKARYLIDLAAECHVNPTIGLLALEMVGVDSVLAEWHRMQKQQERAATEDWPEVDGWCVWCTSAMATRWIVIEGRGFQGVCDECYKVLNRGR